MATVRDLVKGSLRLIGAIATGETPSAEEQADALTALNDMLDSWSTENLIVYAKTRETFSLTGGKSQYTFGAGGDFNSPRPLRIEHAGIIQTGDTFELPINVINKDQYAEIVLKTTQSTMPTRLFAEGTFPLETIDLWPVPSTTSSLVIYSWKPLSTFVTSNADVVLPPGYSRALRYNLAVELSPEYGKSASAEMAQIAMESKESIKRMNSKPVLLHCDGAVLTGQRFNVLTGE